MSIRGAGRAPSRATFAALASVAALSLGACGSDDSPNNPRPSAPIEVTARVDSDKVVVSPDRFGAGLVNFTITNFSDSPVRFTLSGPKHTATPRIPAGAPAGSSQSPTPPVTPSTGSLKVELPQGSYQATAGQGAGIQAATVKVGPKRQSSRNELLLP
jgi:hypothetical protein